MSANHVTVTLTDDEWVAVLWAARAGNLSSLSPEGLMVYMCAVSKIQTQVLAPSVDRQQEGGEQCQPRAIL